MYAHLRVPRTWGAGCMHIAEMLKVIPRRHHLHKVRPKKSIPPDSPRPRTPKSVPVWSLFRFFRTLCGFWKIELPPARELNFEGPDGPENHILAFRNRVATSSPHWKQTAGPGGGVPPVRHKVFYGPVWEALRLRLEILAKSLRFRGPSWKKRRKPRSGTQRFS